MATNWVGVLRASVIGATQNRSPIRMILNLLRNFPWILLKAAGPARLWRPAQGAALLSCHRLEPDAHSRKMRDGTLALHAQI
jgi:hypothetical protein